MKKIANIIAAIALTFSAAAFAGQAATRKAVRFPATHRSVHKRPPTAQPSAVR